MAAALLLALFATPAAANPSFRGVNTHLLWASDSAATDRQLDAAQNLGVNTLRIDVAWQLLEQDGKGRWSQSYLGKLDHFVAGARARGIALVFTVHTTPCWASSAPEEIKQDCSGEWWKRGVGTYPAADARDYGDVAGFLTARYGNALAAFEVWNEPNHAGFFTAPDKPAAYARLLKAAHPAIKAANPRVRVLAGALAYCDDEFLRALYRNGIKGHYDAVSVHPYTGGGPTSYPFHLGLKWNIREAQREAGDTSPVWLTEFGWNTSSVRDAGALSGVDETTQARYLAESFDLLRHPDSGLGFVEAALVYELRDGGTETGDIQHNYGIYRRDYTPKPAWAALRGSFVAQSAPAAPQATNAAPAAPPADNRAPVAPPADNRGPGAAQTSSVTPTDPEPVAGGSSRRLRLAAPRRLRVAPRRKAAVLRWSATRGRSVTRYLVYRRSPGARRAGRRIASTRASRFVDRRVRGGRTYRYWVRARYADGRVGPRSRTVRVRSRAR